VAKCIQIYLFFTGVRPLHYYYSSLYHQTVAVCDCAETQAADISSKRSVDDVVQQQQPEEQQEEQEERWKNGKEDASNGEEEDDNVDELSAEVKRMSVARDTSHDSDQMLTR